MHPGTKARRLAGLGLAAHVESARGILPDDDDGQPRHRAGRGKPGGTFVPVLEQLAAPADFGFDTKRTRVVVPRFMGDAVEAYAIK